MSSLGDISAVSATLLGSGALVAGVKSSWKAFRRVDAVFDAVEPSEDHPGLKQWQETTDQRFVTIDDRLKWVEAELSPNHGSSLRDRIDQIHAKVVQPPEGGS